jgi:hypothetical protein
MTENKEYIPKLGDVVMISREGALENLTGVIYEIGSYMNNVGYPWIHLMIDNGLHYRAELDQLSPVLVSPVDKTKPANANIFDLIKYGRTARFKKTDIEKNHVDEAYDKAIAECQQRHLSDCEYFKSPLDTKTEGAVECVK